MNAISSPSKTLITLLEEIPQTEVVSEIGHKLYDVDDGKLVVSSDHARVSELVHVLPDSPEPHQYPIELLEPIFLQYLVAAPIQLTQALDDVIVVARSLLWLLMFLGYDSL